MTAFHRREDVARYAAPAAFLVAMTILVLLVRAGLSGGRSSGVPTLPVSTAAATQPVTTAPVTSAPKPPAKQFYAIARGDTFSIIARKFNTTVQALQTLNPGVSSSALTIGQQIRVK
ncbi:MAG: LysM peptidoglycan-binding domain-containing protein [Gaiellaceae bacterium]